MEIVLRTLESQRGALVRALTGAAEEMNWRDQRTKEVIFEHALRTAREIREIDEALKTLRGTVDGLGRGYSELPAPRDSAKKDSPSSAERWGSPVEGDGLLGRR